MFLSQSFNSQRFEPLTGMDQFAEWILVPEISVELIMQDLGLTREEAMKTRRESIAYGLGMFRDDENGDNIVSDIMQEVARKRREELRAQERKEMDLEIG